MIRPHKILPNADEDWTIWRYMDIRKFTLLIKGNTLYLNRIDKFEDGKEGTLPAIDEKIFGIKNSDDYFERDRQRRYINCWIKSEHELSLMWSVYGSQGVAIKTTVGKLKESLQDDIEHECYIFPVQYIDYDTESTHENGENLNTLKPYFTKRKFFEQENEVRVLYTDNDCRYEGKEGVNLPVNVKKLIGEIIYSPLIDPMSKSVIDIITQECGLNDAIPSCI